MPFGSFHISITIKNREMFTRLAAKLRSFKDFFNVVIDKWLDHNKTKFEASVGMESTGLSLDSGDVMWKALSPAYMAQKRRDGFEDHLMVRTGELMLSLTERDSFGWWEQVENMTAQFGTLLKQAQYNWETRPTMFLDAVDRDMISSAVPQYLEGTGPFRKYVRSDVHRMDAEFKMMLGVS